MKSCKIKSLNITSIPTSKHNPINLSSKSIPIIDMDRAQNINPSSSSSSAYCCYSLAYFIHFFRAKMRETRQHQDSLSHLIFPVRSGSVWMFVCVWVWVWLCLCVIYLSVSSSWQQTESRTIQARQILSELSSRLKFCGGKFDTNFQMGSNLVKFKKYIKLSLEDIFNCWFPKSVRNKKSTKSLSTLGTPANPG